MRPVRVILLLLGIAAVLVTQLGNPIVDYILMPLLATLLGAHIDREGGRLARAVVQIASRLIPAHRRQSELDEWLDHVESAGEQGIQPLTRAISIAFFAAPFLAVGLRIGRSSRRRRV
jgi:hypothetical protein